MQELTQLFELVPKALALVEPYPAWVKVAAVAAVVVVGLVVLRGLQGEGGE